VSILHDTFEQLDQNVFPFIGPWARLVFKFQCLVYAKHII